VGRGETGGSSKTKRNERRKKGHIIIWAIGPVNTTLLAMYSKRTGSTKIEGAENDKGFGIGWRHSDTYPRDKTKEEIM
jgi:hypothetical protein